MISLDGFYLIDFDTEQLLSWLWFCLLDASETRTLIDGNMEFEKVTVIDGPNGNGTEWTTTSEVINSSSSSDYDIDDGKQIQLSPLKMIST